MGTTFRVSIFDENRKRAIEQSEAMLRIVEEAENQLSTWRPGTELSQLNRMPPRRALPLNPPLCDLFLKVRDWVLLTGGAFDPAIGRVLHAWRIQGAGRIPDAVELTEALSQSGFNRLRIENCTLTKDVDLWFDTGAFGKGEALDRVVAAAKERDFSPFLIDFGGQLAGWKAPPERHGWDARLAHPQDRTATSAIEIVFPDGSISSSGGSEKDLIVEGRRVGHIVDPRTGSPCAAFGSVAVWNVSALAADILSTALYVMGPEAGFRWAVDHQIAACFITSQPPSTRITPAFQKLLPPHSRIGAEQSATSASQSVKSAVSGTLP
ncbi:MAG: FAD:protein FMN transferase [Acidobacteria bacterium]|nr:FAD:protein FMN transferase [Acidobacteriota bacterium]